MGRGAQCSALNVMGWLQRQEGMDVSGAWRREA